MPLYYSQADDISSKEFMDLKSVYDCSEIVHQEEAPAVGLGYIYIQELLVHVQ